MQNYIASEQYLKELNIPTSQPVKITDKEQIKALKHGVYSGKPLPEGIFKRKAGEEEIKDISQYEEPLPEFIEKKQRKVTDPEVLKELRDDRKSGLDIPSKYTYDRVWDKKRQEYKTRFYYKDQFDYYKKHYDFYKTRTLTDEEMRFILESKKNLSVESIASTLKFFKILTIVVIILNVLGVFMFIAALA